MMKNRSSPKLIPGKNTRNSASEQKKEGRDKMKEVMATTMETWTKDRGYVYPHIRKVEDICGGRPCIDGTRVRVVDIVFLQKEGYTPE